MSDEWGPWVEHDGTGCPCIGFYVHVSRLAAPDKEVIAGAECIRNGVDPNSILSAWVWEELTRPNDVMRYRVRKPRGLTILEGLLENLPEKVDA